MSDDAAKLEIFDKPAPCIVCGAALEPAFTPREGEAAYQPYATSFTTHGHYGSYFDPNMASRDYLRINVCHECMSAAAKGGRIWLCRPEYQAPPATEHSLYDPETYDG